MKVDYKKKYLKYKNKYLQYKYKLYYGGASEEGEIPPGTYNFPDLNLQDDMDDNSNESNESRPSSVQSQHTALGLSPEESNAVVNLTRVRRPQSAPASFRPIPIFSDTRWQAYRDAQDLSQRQAKQVIVPQIQMVGSEFPAEIDVARIADVAAAEEAAAVEEAAEEAARIAGAACNQRSHKDGCRCVIQG